MEPIRSAKIAELAAASTTNLAGLHARGALDDLLDEGLLGTLAAGVDATDVAREGGDVRGDALVKLLSVAAVTRRFVQDVGLARVVGWLDSPEERVARTGVHVVSWLVWHPSRSLRMQVVAAGIAPRLVARLHVDLEAVDALARLAATPETVGALEAAGAFDALAAHLPRWVTDTTCMHALGPCLAHHDVRRGLIAAGWPATLRGLLRHEGAYRLLARLLPAMDPAERLRTLHDLSDWEFSLRPGDVGVGFRAVASCLPELRARLALAVQEPTLPGGPDLDCLVRGYGRYDAMAEFQRSHASALADIRDARARARVRSRYRRLLEAWDDGSPGAAEDSLETISVACAREDFADYAFLREALASALRRAHASASLQAWSSTCAFAAQLATRASVEEILWRPENIIVFASVWQRDVSREDLGMGTLWVEPRDAYQAQTVLLAALRVLELRREWVGAQNLSLASLRLAAASPVEAIAGVAQRVSRWISVESARRGATAAA